MNEPSNSVDELMELEREILRKFQAGKLDEALDRHLTEDALVCPPGMEAVKGREKQRQLFKELLSLEGVDLSWDPIEAHVSPSDEMGWVFGWVKWKLPNQAEQEGKYISIWVRQNGEWRNVVEIRNANH